MYKNSKITFMDKPKDMKDYIGHDRDIEWVKLV